MKTCKYCGQIYEEINNDIEDKYCPYCGKEYDGEILTEIVDDADPFDLDFEQNRKKYWLGLGLYFGIFYIGAVIIQLVLSVIIIAINGYTDLTVGSPEYQEYEITLLSWSNILIYVAAMGAIIPIVWKTLNKDWINLKEQPGKNWKWFGIGIGLMYAGIYTSSILISIITFIFGLQAGESDNQATIEAIMTSNALNCVLMCIMTVICAPILEEIVFRRCLFGVFKKKTFVTVILSAVIFASIHTVPACLAMIPEVISGDIPFESLFLEAIYILNYMGQAFALSFVYYKTEGNLIPCILIHVVNNFIATIGILLLPM